MGTIRRNLYCILSGKSLLFAQGAAWMGKCLLRFSHLIQITGDLLFTCTAHSSVEKKVGDEISPSHPRSLPAYAGSGFPCRSRCMEFAYDLCRTDYQRRCRRARAVQWQGAWTILWRKAGTIQWHWKRAIEWRRSGRRWLFILV